MEIKYRIELDQGEVDLLNNCISRGKNNAQLVRRARVLLACNDGVMTDMEIAASLRISRQAVGDIRRRFVENGFEVCLNGLPRRHAPSIMHGENQARLIQLAGEAREDGVRRWSLRAIACKLVTLEGGEV